MLLLLCVLQHYPCCCCHCQLLHLLLPSLRSPRLQELHP
jgi:hypothetical protein